MFLATELARCIRFQITDETLRVFSGRDSSGVRGIRLQPKDRVISLSVLRHVDATVEERVSYLKNSRRRGAAEEEVNVTAAGEDQVAEIALSGERFEELESAEEILLTVNDGGFGKRSSAYESRVTGRGGQGITNMTLSAHNGTSVVASFPVRPGDGVMLVTDEGRLIRVPSDQVRVTGRSSMGVTLFRLGETERVSSVFPILDSTDATEGDGEGDPAADVENNDG